MHTLPACNYSHRVLNPRHSEENMSMQRRNFLASIGAAGLLGLAGPRRQMAQEQAARATRAMPIPKIKDIRVIECQPDGVRLTVVKIVTDQDGLYGYGDRK